jgi:hypothetical protein
VQKSAQSIENKRVAFLLNAKCARECPGRWEERAAGCTPPIKMDHFQNKGVAGIAFCK